MNRVIRRSNESSLFVPLENIYNPDVVRRKIQKKANGYDNSSYNFCGWPSYMMIPKGSAEGLPFILFAMVSNGKDDSIMVRLK